MLSHMLCYVMLFYIILCYVFNPDLYHLVYLMDDDDENKNFSPFVFNSANKFTLYVPSPLFPLSGPVRSHPIKQALEYGHPICCLVDIITGEHRLIKHKDHEKAFVETVRIIGQPKSMKLGEKVCRCHHSVIQPFFIHLTCLQ